MDNDASLILYFSEETNLEHYSEWILENFFYSIRNVDENSSLKFKKLKKTKNKISEIVRNPGACLDHKRQHKKCPLECENRKKLSFHM